MKRTLGAILILGISLMIGFAHPISFAQESRPSSPHSSAGPYKGFGHAWENNDLGISNQVPEPWTAIQYGSDSLKCWGREYLLSKSILPRQITSQGQELFARAPGIDLVIEDRSVFSDQRTQPTLTLKGHNRGQYQIVHSAEGYRVESTASLEYDGFFRIDITVTPRKPMTINQLQLNFPFHARVGRFYSRFLEYDFETHFLDRGDFSNSFGRIGHPIQMKFNPAVWIGNHDIGLEWVCETNAGWSSDNPGRAIQIQPGADAVSMQIQVVSRPLRITQPYTFSFALYPTPVKKLPDDWRAYHLTQLAAKPEALDTRTQKVYALGWGPKAFPVKYIGLPVSEPSSASAVDLMLGEGGEVPAGGGESAAARIANARRRVRDLGMKFIPYSALYGMPARLPHGEWKDYASVWGTMQPEGAIKNPIWAMLEGIPRGEPSRISTCLYPKSYRDFLVWHFVQAIEKDDIDGLYLDLASPNVLCRNRNHPHGEHVGAGGVYYPFFWQRELMQRLYVACKSRKRDFFMTVHHAKMPIVCSGFSDLVLSGEALNVFFRGPSWTMKRAREDPSVYVPDYGRLPDELYEIQYSQRKGFISMLLPQIMKANEKLMRSRPQLLDKYTRTLLSRAALYDIPLEAVRMGKEAYNSFLRAQQRFGWLTGSDHYGPWESGRFLSSGADRLKVALYAKPKENKVMVVLANYSAELVRETVSINPEALRKVGLNVSKSLRAREAMEDKPYPVENGRIQISVPGNDFRMLILQ